MKINWESDLKVAVTFCINGQEITPPAHNFMLRFKVEGGTRTFNCTYKDGVYTNCKLNDEGTQVLCFIKNHRLGIGKLQVKYYDFAPDCNFSDGTKLTVTPSTLDIELVKGVGDDTSQISADVAVNIENLLADKQNKDYVCPLTHDNGYIITPEQRNAIIRALNGGRHAYVIVPDRIDGSPDICEVTAINAPKIYGYGVITKVVIWFTSEVVQVADHFAAVAFSGSYNDLTDKPESPTSLYRNISVRMVAGVDHLYIDGAEDLIAQGCRPVLFRYCVKRNRIRRGVSRYGVESGHHEKAVKGWNMVGIQWGKGWPLDILSLRTDKFGTYLCINPRKVWGGDFTDSWQSHPSHFIKHTTTEAVFGRHKYDLYDDGSGGGGSGDPMYYIRRFTYGIAFVKGTPALEAEVIDKGKLASPIVPFRLCWENGMYYDVYRDMCYDEVPAGGRIEKVNILDRDSFHEFLDNNDVQDVLESRFFDYFHLTDKTYLVFVTGVDDSHQPWVMLGKEDLVNEMVAKKRNGQLDPRTFSHSDIESPNELLFYNNAVVTQSTDFCWGESYAGMEDIMQELQEDGIDAEPVFLIFDTAVQEQGFHWGFGK